MKLRYIFTMLASLLMLAFTGCQEEEGRFLDEVKVSQSYIAIPAEGGSVDITVDAIDSWSIAGVPEWLTVSPASGSAGQTKVTFSAGAATATNEATLALNCAGVSQTINVLQMTEKLEVPLSTCNFVNTQGEDGVIYRVKGTVTSIANTQYGNWYLDDGTGVVYIYGTLYEGATQQFTKHGLEVGDIVTVEGPRKNYNGTIELVDVTVIEIEKSLIKIDAVEPETGILPIEGGEFKVTLTCKGDGVSVNVPEDAKSWLYVTGLSTSGSEAVVTFTATENPAGKRNADLEFVTVSGGVEYKAMTSVTQEGSIAEVSVADFLAASEGTALFKLTGKVKNLQASDYGNFDLVDATGSVYVYGLTATPVAKNDKSFPTLGIKEGDVVTLIGTRASYNGTAQVGGPAYYVSHVGHVESTVADFLAQPTAADKWYQLTGTIANLVNETYGNFDLVGEDGSSVYVYGLTVAPVAKNDKSFAQLGLKEGDVVTLIGTRAEYNGTAQVGGPAYYISHVAGGSDDNTGDDNTGDDNTGDDNTGDDNTSAFASNVVFGTVSSAYTDGVATVNGVENVATLKLGTSKLYGEGTVTLPAGTTKVSCYAVAWKNNPAKLEFSVDGTVLGTQEIAANVGATGNSPYTITVADSDHYTITLPVALPAETVVTVKTVETGYRAIIFGVVAE